MAVVLNFPERLAAERGVPAEPLVGAEIVILPCIRRERIGQCVAFGGERDMDRATQRHA